MPSTFRLPVLRSHRRAEALLCASLAVAFCPALSAQFAQSGSYVIITVAGGGSALGSNGQATSAMLNTPNGVAVDSAGNLYIADTDSNRIRKVSNGVISTVAGGGPTLGDNGPATSAMLNIPMGVAVDSAGNLYIADTYNNRIRKISNGVITTVAGNGTAGFSGDNGPATSAQLGYPMGVAVDSAGNLYIADSNNHLIRKVSNGVITTVAGGGSSGLGDNGPATSAQLTYVYGVAVDSAGNIYIADSSNHRIRKVSGGVITTVAGNGTRGFSGDNGSATSAQLNVPAGVAVDSAGNLYIADLGNNRIRKVSTGVITTVAGNGPNGYSGDGGPATSAQLNQPTGVAVDASGSLFIADSDDNRIRQLVASPTPGIGCVYSIDQSAHSFGAAGGSSSVGVLASGTSCPWLAISYPDWITVSPSGVSSGTGLVTYSVSPNPYSASRAGTIWIAGSSLTINQSGVVCSLGVGPQSVSVAASGLTGASLTVTSNAPDCPWTAAANVSWILVSGGNTGMGSGAVTYTVGVNTGCQRAGTITVAGQAVQINQAASGGGAACNLTFTPSSLNFGTYQVGGAAPGGQNVSVGSSGATLTFSASANTSGGGNWLSVTPTSGTTPATLQVSIAPVGLPRGTYNGTITITSTGASNSPQAVSVTLMVSAPPALTISQSTLGFSYQPGGAAPGGQNVSVGSSGTALTFSASANTTGGGNWLSVGPSSGTTPASLSISVNPSGLGTGRYSGSITITSTGASNSPQSISVTLTLTSAPTISISPNVLQYAYQSGGNPPQAQVVTVAASSAAAFTAVASGGTWLSVSPASGTTPASLSVSVNPAGLNPGTYNGTITVTGTNGTQGTLIVNVTLAVTAPLPRVGGVLTCTLSTISGPYGYAISGILPASGGITPFADYGTFVADGNGAFTGSSTTSTGGAIAAKGISGKYSINANCTGVATFQDTAGNILHVSFTVVDNGGEIQFIQTDSATVVSGKAQRAPTGCDSSAVSGPYTYAISGWLVGGGFRPFADAGRIVADGSGNLSGKSTYSAFGTIGRRTFSGTYSIGSACSGTATLRDSLGNVETLAITVVSNGQQVLFIESDSGTVVSGGSQRGQYACTTGSLTGPYAYALEGYQIRTNGSIVPAADSGLFTSDGNGHFGGADSISVGGTVVSRTVSGSYTVNADCTGSAVLTDTLGDTVNLDVFVADDGTQVQFIETDSGTVISGSAPQYGGTCTNSILNGSYGYAIEGWAVSSNTTPFADSGQLIADGAGHFSGSSTTSSDGTIIGRTLSGSYQINSDCSGSAVLRDNLGDTDNLRLTASSDGRQVGFIETDNGTIISGGAQRQLALPSDGIVSAAGFAPGAAVPGSLFTIFGDGFASGVAGATAVPLPKQLGGTSVSVNGTAVPLLYVSPGQINAQLPLEIQQGPAQLVVSANGVTGAPVTFTVPNAWPGIFTYGLSRAIAVNSDGSVSGPVAPTHSGDTIVVYLTGGGPVQPSNGWITGSASPPGLSRVTLPFTVTIGGIPASVDYLGLTPASVGLYQLNVHVPALPAGDHTLVVTVSGNFSNSALISVAP